MEKVWLLVTYGLTFVEWLSFYCIVLKEKIKKPTCKGMIFLLIMVTLRLTGILFWEKSYFLLDVVWVAFSCAFFSLSVLQALKKWIISLSIISVLEGCISCILEAYLPYDSIEERIGILLCAGIVCIIMYLYYLFVGKNLNRERFDLPRPIWRLFIGLIIVIMLMMSYFVFVLEDVPNIRMVKFGSIIILLGGLSICGMIIAVIYYFNGTEKYRMQNEMAEKYNKQQREYFTRLLEKEQDTKQFRHDIINHLLAMKDIADKEESFALQEYVQGLLQDINSEKYKQYDIGNDVVNTVLNYYLLPIKDNCIITLNGYMEEIGHYDQKDLCTLFSNIIKNAVEAVEKVEETNREIHIRVNQGEKYLNIEIENTMCQELVLDENGVPLTSKNDKTNHGLGLQNVKKVVEKYNGTYEIKIEKNTFITEIYLKT